MQFTTLFSAAGLVALAAAAPAELASRSSLVCNNLLTASGCNLLKAIGVGQAGSNSAAGMAQGSKGPNVFNVNNKSKQDIVLVSWGPNKSWVNTNQPDVTVSIAAGKSATFSAPNGYSGAMSAVYPDTKMVNGQISNTWLEFTTGSYGVIDVSREPNMSGNPISATITNSYKKSCTSDMDTCVFKCNSGNVCMTGYILENCASGSQNGLAQTGTYGGAASGGCGGFGTSATVDVNFS